jgi:hypothetical protein
MLQSDAVRVGVVRSGYLAPDDGLAMATIHSTDDSHPADRAPAPRDDNLGSVISWKGVAAGAVTALVISLSLGRLTADALETNLGAQAAMLMVAMFVGGFVAGKVAGGFGVIQGVAIAVIFILIGASIKAYWEIDLATKFGPNVLGPMDMGGLILGDFVYLIGGSAGGWLADTLTRRARMKRT